MIKLNTSKILVPFNFSVTSKKALKHAAALAISGKGELQLLYVRKPQSIFNIGLSTLELRRLAGESKDYKKIMENTAEEIRQKYRIPVKVLVDVGRHIPGILKICERNQVGLIVMGTEGADSVSNLFSGSNSHQVVSRSHIPVITVRAESPRHGYANILVPVDLSEHTRQKMIAAIQLARTFSSKIHLVGLQMDTDKSNETKLNSILRQIENRLKEENIAYTCECIKTENAAARTLAAAKRKKADIIIAMTDQRPHASLLRPRCYDHELVDESRIPVLSVPPEIHEENIEPASIGGLW